jgi:ankyrin repeat protein
VPLITKLVGEFFESKISEYFRASAGDIEVFIERLEKETFDLIKLYDHFVEKKLQVYYEEKCRMILSNPQASNLIKQMKQKILENYETLAVRQILKTDVEKYFSSIAAKEIDKLGLEDLVKIGLVYKANNQWKFSHQTYAEYGFKKFLDKNFDDENCAKFIVEVVLVDPSYQVIRTFMNFWIWEKVNEKTCAVYQNSLLESSIRLNKGTPLHVAGREGNENIFCFLYSALAKKTQYFESMKMEIQDYLLKMPKTDSNSRIHSYTAFVHYFHYCEDHLNILSQVQSDFGVEFVKKIFTIQINRNEKLLYAICLKNSENILKLLIFVRDFLSKDLKFLREVFLSADNDGESFLHYAFWFLKNETLSKLLEELNLSKSVLGQDFLNELILMGSHEGVFLSSYIFSKHFSNDFFISFLNQIKLMCDQETLKKFFFVVDTYSDTLLHKCCFSIKNFDLLQVLQWVARELGTEVLTELILVRDEDDYTFFFWFTSSKRQSNSGSKLLSILRFLKNDLKFENDFLIHKILFNDKDSDYYFSNLFKKNQEKEFYQNFLEFLANELSGESLKIYLIRTKFLFLIAQNGDKKLLGEIFNTFVAKFGETFFSRSYSIETFHGIYKKHPNNAEMILNYLNLVAEQIDFEVLSNYVSGKNSKHQTILFYFHRDSPSDNLIKMLGWFGTTFKNDENFLKNFLLEIDENSDSFLIFVLRNCENGWIQCFFKYTYQFLIENFDKVIIKELLLLQNNEDKNFLEVIFKRCGKHDVIQILDKLFKDFQNDQDFFTKLIKEKLKKNREVENFMKNKYNNDLPEKEVKESEILNLIQKHEIGEMEFSEKEVEVSRSSCCRIC